MLRVLLALRFLYGFAVSNILIWPPPASLNMSGSPRLMHPELNILARAPGNAVLDSGILRYSAAIQRFTSDTWADSAHHAATALRSLLVSVERLDDNELSMYTDESYELELRTGNDTAHLSARTVFGALYGIESFMQLLGAGRKGWLVASEISIADVPDFAWRGLMVDSGRRFWPVDLVKNTLDTMSAVKLNVLHLHVSDHCRWAVESKVYPQLTAGLVGQFAGHYTRADIKELIAYAKARAIRIVPEFEFPAHARGMLPLNASAHKDLHVRGVDFCQNASREDPSYYMHRDQLYNNPTNNRTLTTLHALLGEMAELFEDPVMHIGGDETYTAGPCNKTTNKMLQQALCAMLSKNFDKTPAGWEEFLFDADAASLDSIIQAWGGSVKPANITASGRKAINSIAEYFYTKVPNNGSANWARSHTDLARGVPPTQRPLVLGGELATWTDSYCPTLQCHAFEGPVQPAAAMFSPAQDVAFSKSSGGLLWPWGYVGAGSFWRYDASLDPRSADFEAAMFKLNDELAARGSIVCPSHCSCDLLTACGKPYVEDSTFSVDLVV